MKRFVTAAACVALWLVAYGHTPAPEWKPVEPALPVEKKPVVEADAETIFRDLDLIDTFRNRNAETTIRNYVRFPFREYSRVGDIAARTSKPEGSIVELRKE